MLFNSYEFILLFLPVTLIAVCLLRARGARWVEAVLLLASLVFYAWWDVRLLPLLLGSIAGNYALAHLIERSRSRALFVASIAANLLILAYFKYLGFFAGIASGLTPVTLDVGTIVLPLAISFFTFQQIGYQVDRWRGATTAHDFLDFAFFVSFFPQLIAGPIVRQGEMLPQLRRFAARITPHNLLIGLTFFSIGLFKKVMLADNFERYASPVFDGAQAGTAPEPAEAWLGSLAYTFQIYFDFSGYSDMAIGLARMFGIYLPINFNAPYRALSVTDFWRRWHITLSRFLRDYLYIPLGGNRKGAMRRIVNILIVMFLGGLWHGAAWTFVIWGMLHGAGLVLHRVWHRWFGLGALGLPGRCVAWAATFLFVVVAWVFFRAGSLEAAFLVLKAMSGLGATELAAGATVPFVVPLEAMDREVGGWLLVATGLAWVLLLPASHGFMRRHMRARLYRDYLPATGLVTAAWRARPAWIVASAALFAAAFLGLSRVNEFIYYQF